MIYTVIDIYEVLRTDEIYPSIENSISKNNDVVCTNPYKYLSASFGNWTGSHQFD